MISSSRRLLAAAVLFALAFLALYGAAQQDRLTCDQVLHRALETLGGSEKLGAVHTWFAKGEWTNATTGESGTWESYYEEPNLRAMALMDRNATVRELWGCDGHSAWRVLPEKGIVAYKPGLWKTMDCQGSGLTPVFLEQQGRHSRMELKAAEQIDDRPAIAVKIWAPAVLGGPPHGVANGVTKWVTFYFDARTYLFVRMVGEDETNLSDFRDLDGIKVPFVETRSERSELTGRLKKRVREVWTTSAVKINGPIDSRVFQKPGRKHPWVSMAAAANP
jgi:hypothetical protein